MIWRTVFLFIGSLAMAAAQTNLNIPVAQRAALANLAGISNQLRVLNWRHAALQTDLQAIEAAQAQQRNLQRAAGGAVRSAPVAQPAEIARKRAEMVRIDQHMAVLKLRESEIRRANRIPEPQPVRAARHTIDAKLNR